MITAAQTKAVSDKITRLLPDDPREAITTLALCYACVVCATLCDDESAIEAVRRALKQMREARDHTSIIQGIPLFRPNRRRTG